MVRESHRHLSLAPSLLNRCPPLPSLIVGPLSPSPFLNRRPLSPSPHPVHKYIGTSSFLFFLPFFLFSFFPFSQKQRSHYNPPYFVSRFRFRPLNDSENIYIPMRNSPARLNRQVARSEYCVFVYVCVQRKGEGREGRNGREDVLSTMLTSQRASQLFDPQKEITELIYLVLSILPLFSKSLENYKFFRKSSTP